MQLFASPEAKVGRGRSERRSPDRPASRVESKQADQEIGAPMLRRFMAAVSCKKGGLQFFAKEE